MSSNWDRTQEVLSGRGGILARIAIPALFVPAVVRDGWTAIAAHSPVLAGIGVVLAIAALLAQIWGQLAVVAVASDPATTLRDGAAQASRRLLPALGLYALAVVAVMVVALPIVVALAGSNIDWAAASRGQAPQIAPGLAGFVGLYLVVLFVAALFVSARLFVLNPVLVNERQGIRSFARSWSLTRGLTWRIIGVTLLFAIVWLIAASAAKFITGIVFRLALGPGAGAAFAAALVGAVVTTLYMVVISVFAAQLWVALSGRRAADVFA